MIEHGARIAREINILSALKRSDTRRMDGSTSKTLSPSSSGSGKVHLGEGMALSGLRRALSQVSMLVVKATTSGEAAWRDELHKYVAPRHLLHNRNRKRSNERMNS